MSNPYYVGGSMNDAEDEVKNFKESITQEVQTLINNSKFAENYLKVLSLPAVVNTSIYIDSETYHGGASKWQSNTKHLTTFEVAVRLKKWVSIADRITSGHLKETLPNILQDKYAIAVNSIQVTGTFDHENLQANFRIGIHTDKALTDYIKVRMNRDLFDE